MTREETASIIRRLPWHYKVCEGCDSVVHRRFDLCQNCHGYRFDHHISSVRACVARIERETKFTHEN
jgi:hypothetical protein